MKRKETEEKKTDIGQAVPKRKGNSVDIDPKMILNCFRSDDTSISPAARVTESRDGDDKPTVSEKTDDKGFSIGVEVEGSSKKPQKVNAKDKDKIQFYIDTFYKDVGISAKSGKTVYLCKEHHERIQKLVRVVGKDETSLFSYIYNVIDHHFSLFHDEIEESYETNNSIF